MLNIRQINNYGNIEYYNIKSYIRYSKNTSHKCIRSILLPRWEIMLVGILYDIRDPILYLINPNIGKYIVINNYYTNNKINNMTIRAIT